MIDKYPTFEDDVDDQLAVLLPALRALYKALEEVTQEHALYRHEGPLRDCPKSPCIDSYAALALAEDAEKGEEKCVIV